jgi:hypothetical protein
MNPIRSALTTLCFGILIATPGASFASGIFSGHAGVYSYSYGDSAEASQAELLTNLSFTIRDGSGLAARFSGRLREPLTDAPVEDWNLYSGYLEWASQRKSVSITAGRRLLFAGVVRGIQDGGVIELRRRHRSTAFSLMAMIGKDATYDLETGPEDNPNPWTFGLIARARPLRGLDITLSSRINLEDKDEGTAFSDLVGISAGWRPTETIHFDGVLHHDLTRERVERSRAGLSVSRSRYTFSAEYLYTASPWIPENSWYSRFEEFLDSYTQYRTGFSVDLPALNGLSTGLYWIVQDNSDDQSINGYVTVWDKLTLGYRFSGNDDFRKNGFYGFFAHRLNDMFRFNAGVDFSEYKVYSLYNLPSYGSHLRLGFLPHPSWRLFGEVQYRKDQVMDTDVRLLCGLNYRFKSSYGNQDK